MMDWGIPDWRDPASYGQTDEWSEARWAWEFIRRREDYRSDAQEFLDMDGAAPERRRVWHEFFNKYGYMVCLHPWVSEQPEDLLLRWPKNSIGWTTGKESTWVSVNQNELNISFDLDTPIPEQLVAAKRVLQAKQVERHGKKLQTRPRKNLWLKYLRALDSRACSASHAERRDLLGQNHQSDSLEGRDILEAALALRDNF